jgi:hypothetical protein
VSVRGTKGRGGVDRPLTCAPPSWHNLPATESRGIWRNAAPGTLRARGPTASSAVPKSGKPPPAVACRAETGGSSGDPALALVGCRSLDRHLQKDTPGTGLGHTVARDEQRPARSVGRPPAAGAARPSPPPSPTPPITPCPTARPCSCATSAPPPTRCSSSAAAVMTWPFSRRPRARTPAAATSSTTPCCAWWTATSTGRRQPRRTPAADPDRRGPAGPRLPGRQGDAVHRRAGAAHRTPSRRPTSRSRSPEPSSTAPSTPVVAQKSAHGR